jgi:hypothetical protein
MILNEINNLIEESLGKILGKTALGAAGGAAAAATSLAVPAVYLKNMVVNPIKGVGQIAHSGAAWVAPGLIKQPSIAQAPSLLKNLKTAATIKGIATTKNIYDNGGI